MTIHSKDLKKPDAFLSEGRKILVILEKNLQIILVGTAIIGLVVGGLLIVNNQTQKKELSLQSDYYRIEKSYLKKLEDQEKSKAEIAEISKGEDSKKDSAKSVGSKAIATDNANKNANSISNNSSGSNTKEIEKYESEISQFRALIDKAPESKAAAMSALAISNLFFGDKKWEDGLKVLDQVYQHQKKNNLIKALLTHSLGIAQANLGKCDVAIQTWGSLLKDKTFDFMADELKLNTALCQEQLGQSVQAEELLTTIKSKTDSPQSKIAEKYLRFFKYKKQGS